MSAQAREFSASQVVLGLEEVDGQRGAAAGAEVGCRPSDQLGTAGGSRPLTAQRDEPVSDRGHGPAGGAPEGLP